MSKVLITGVKQDRLQHSSSKAILPHSEYTVAWPSDEPHWEQLKVVPDWLWCSSSGYCKLRWDMSHKLFTLNGTFPPTNHRLEATFLTFWQPGLQERLMLTRVSFTSLYLQQDIPKLIIPKTGVPEQLNIRQCWKFSFPQGWHRNVPYIYNMS